MAGLLTLVASILVFGVVILVHELGHYLAAKRCGIRVDEFSIGMGPALWQTEKNGTRYAVRLLPIGGYNLLGDVEHTEPEEMVAPADAGAVPPKAPSAKAAPWPAVMAGKPLSEAGVGQRIFVFAAGALMNFVLGFCILFGLLCSQESITSKMIYGFTEDALCAQTGLKAGDEIVKVNGSYCFVAEDVLYELQRANNYTADFTVLRDGQKVELPGVQFGTTTAEDGTTSMVLEFTVYGIAKTPLSLLRGATNYTLYYARTIIRSFVDLARGRVSVNDLSGPVGIVSAIGQAVQYGLADLLRLAALITINLGIFNLLPLPALDGGRLLFLAVEGATGHPVPERVQMAVNALGMVLLMMLMVFTTMQDFTRLF
ncbi:MAG: RIP metalloprotease RseP [Gemmiger sp.]|nr:RIP metalloprotease RseP [Gemmiger sp.]